MEVVEIECDLLEKTNKSLPWRSVWLQCDGCIDRLEERNCAKRSLKMAVDWK